MYRWWTWRKLKHTTDAQTQPGQLTRQECTSRPIPRDVLGKGGLGKGREKGGLLSACSKSAFLGMAFRGSTYCWGLDKWLVMSFHWESEGVPGVLWEDALGMGLKFLCIYIYKRNLTYMIYMMILNINWVPAFYLRQPSPVTPCITATHQDVISLPLEFSWNLDDSNYLYSNIVFMWCNLQLCIVISINNSYWLRILDNSKSCYQLHWHWGELSQTTNYSMPGTYQLHDARNYGNLGV